MYPNYLYFFVVKFPVNFVIIPVMLTVPACVQEIFMLNKGLFQCISFVFILSHLK